jgi:hypothetical protein
MRRFTRQELRQLLRSTLKNAQRSAAKSWWAVRQIFGDAAYENYLRAIHAQRESAQDGASTDISTAAAPLSPADFYLDSLRRRYSRISRCC